VLLAFGSTSQPRTADELGLPHTTTPVPGLEMCYNCAITYLAGRERRQTP